MIRVRPVVSPSALCVCVLWRGATHCFCNSSMRFLREMTWKQHMSVFLNLSDHTWITGSWIVTAVLYHGVLTNTQIILAWCSKLIESSIMFAIYSHMHLCFFAHPSANGIELEKSHTLTCIGNILGCVRFLIDSTYSFNFTMSACLLYHVCIKRLTCCEGSCQRGHSVFRRDSIFDLSPVV